MPNEELIVALEKATGSDTRPFGDHYLVTASGRVWSTKVQRFLKHGLSGKGYARLCLQVGGKTKHLRLNRIVAEAFHGPPPSPDSVARHLDDDRSNNHESNIAWGTHSDNAKDAVRNGVSAAAKTGKAHASKVAGANCGKAKLTWEKVDAIRARRLCGETYPSIAKDYGLDQSTIYHICKGKTWREEHRP